MRRLFWGLGVLSLALSAHAQIYSYVDEQGNTVFTDQAPNTSQPVETVVLPPVNQIAAPAADFSLAPIAPTEDQKPFSVLKLTNVPTDEAIRANNGMVQLTASIEPPLSENQQLVFILDGKPAAPASQNLSITVGPLNRGEHHIQLHVVSPAGVIQSSAKETFYIQRVHLGNRQRPVPL